MDRSPDGEQPSLLAELRIVTTWLPPDDPADGEQLPKPAESVIEVYLSGEPAEIE
jgi:hypothetical protein